MLLLLLSFAIALRPLSCYNEVVDTISEQLPTDRRCLPPTYFALIYEIFFFCNVFLFACAFLFLKEASPSSAMPTRLDYQPESERLSGFLGRRHQSIASSALTFSAPNDLLLLLLL